MEIAFPDEWDFNKKVVFGLPFENIGDKEINGCKAVLTVKDVTGKLIKRLNITNDETISPVPMNSWITMRPSGPK